MRRATRLIRHLAPRSTPSRLSNVRHATLKSSGSLVHHPTSSSLRCPPCSSSFSSSSSSQSNRSSSSSSSSTPTQDIRPLLKHPSLFRQSNYFNGQWHDANSSPSPIAVDNPSTRAIIGHIPSVTDSDVKSAITASASAQADWANRTCHERGLIVRRWYELTRQHEQDLGTLMSLEQGKPQKEAVGEVQYAAGFLDLYSSEATRQFGDVIPSPSPASRILVTYQPVGVVAAITPWNFPAAMITRKVGAAIAAGCSVVLKPSELTPFTALALCDLALQAGLPPNVFQVVTGDASVIGPIFTSHPTVRKVAFTGSTRVGKLLIEQSASTVKRTSMELGGNAPLIVFDDADLSQAVKGIMINKFRNCGQTCVTVNRVYLHRSIQDEVVKRVREEMAKLKVGDGMAEGSVIGPLINDASIEKVERHVKDALSKGAKLQLGGKRLTHSDSPLIPTNSSGLYYSPTLITGATPEMEAFHEETFGPVAFVYTFDDEKDVIEQANNTRAGLAAYVYTKDVSRVDRVCRGLEYGMIGVNQGTVSVPSAPFGGMKESGFGREGSHHGLKDYLDMKTTHIAV